MHSFRKAILTTGATVLCAIAIITVIVYPYLRGDVYYYQDRTERQEIAGQIDTIICGASYAAWGVNPEILDDTMGCSSYNLSGIYQTMAGRYALLKEELERNPVKTVFFELSAYTMARNRPEEGPEGDIYVLGRLDSIKDQLGFAKEVFYADEAASVLYDTIHRGIYAWGQALRQWTDENRPTERGYRWMESHEIWIPCPEDIYHTEQLETEFQAENLRYFDLCMKLCEEKNVRVILFATPISDYQMIKAEGLNEIYLQYVDLANRYQLEFYDFSLKKTRSFDYPCWYNAYNDSEHLSGEGAMTFSRELGETILAVDRGEDISSEFLHDYKEALDYTMAILEERNS